MDGFDYSADPQISAHMDTFMRNNMRGYEKVGGAAISLACLWHTGAC